MALSEDYLRVWYFDANACSVEIKQARGRGRWTMNFHEHRGIRYCKVKGLPLFSYQVTKLFFFFSSSDCSNLWSNNMRTSWIRSVEFQIFPWRSDIDNKKKKKDSLRKFIIFIAITDILLQTSGDSISGWFNLNFLSCRPPEVQVVFTSIN